MSGANAKRSLARSENGSVVTEFALLAPLFLTLVIGILQVSVYMQNYNAVRSAVSDSARHVVVEYQKSNEITDDQIRSVIRGVAVNPPYMLDTDRLDIQVSRAGTSRVAGATEIDVDLAYQLEDWLPFVEIPGTRLTYSRPIFVVESGGGGGGEGGEGGG